jgi:hypothetical protein
MVEEVGLEGEDAAVLPEGDDESLDGLGLGVILGAEVVAEFLVQGVELGAGLRF